MRRLWLACLALVACDPSFQPTFFEPAHVIDEEGALHGARFEDPFGCGVAGAPFDSDETEPCPTDGRPPDARLSCDALGCHGGYDYTPSGRRELTGSEGPSCYTCHGEEWETEDRRGRD